MGPQRHTLTYVGIALFVVLGTILASCAPAATPAPAPVVPTSAPAAPAATAAPATAAPAAAAPTTLNIAAILETVVEQPYGASFIQSVDRLKKKNAHNLTINLDYTENILPPDAQRVLLQYAQSGKYQIIWAHSSYEDAVIPLAKQFPDIAWVVTGSGNKGVGGNIYWIDVYDQEPAYLLGLLAGKLTKSNIIGAVASFPYANVNLPVNAFISGAQSVNPAVKARVSFIQSWWDPAKGKESALAQIADGADNIFAERFGPFDACDQKSVYCYGYFSDQNSMSPSVVASAMAFWDPGAETVIDAWYNHVTKGTAYNAPMNSITFSMKDGGSGFALNPAYDSKLPQDVKDLVTKAQADILSGALKIPENDQAPSAAATATP
jgi:basic membrane protein A and related proteins